ncbi:NAD-dependent epimerase/dehydratase [Cynara cardunculus var. scolymus]|uniref:NAD-dependent epimerase/dehydratase n=1 Tax=Cynara cardunculus var. scolymus TaxID=59895 RepID=A0A118JT23_CYNCS|nr:NAD-dependent epimerase/dehydratase [Cynara cardunculus var. scolymus]
MESKSRCKVCVTGGAGYIGSALIHSLLQIGYTVHATLRNLEERLHLFEADIYKPQEFEEAIQGCVYVFHVATPIYHTSGYKYNDKIEATISAIKKIADVCIQSRTVRRLIYTASVVAASPLKDDGSGYKTTMDESCWTPLYISVPYSNDFVKEYTEAKTRAEQEILKIGEDKANELEVVTLSCGLVGGGGHLPYTTSSVMLLISQVINNETQYQMLRYLEELMGKIPIVHIKDVCRAHIFCIEMPMVNGRFLCSSSYITGTWKDQRGISNGAQESLKMKGFLTNTMSRRSWMIVSNMQRDQAISNKNLSLCFVSCFRYTEGPKREIKWGSTKLRDKGFSYKHDTKTTLDDCIECAMRSDNI